MTVNFSRDRFKDLFRHTSDGIFVLDKDWRIVAMNPKAEALCGWEKSDLVNRRICTEVFICHDPEGRELCDLNCPKQKALESGKSGGPIDVKVMHKNGSLAFTPGRCLYLQPLDGAGTSPEENSPLAAILIRDEGDQRRLTEMLLEKERRDPLTGLFHRQYFEELFGIELKRAKRHGGILALLMLDVRSLREINSRFGDATGDSVLKSIGQVIRKGIREIDIAGRFGGDEFAVLLYGVDETKAKACVRRLRQAFEKVRGAGSFPEEVGLNLAIEVTGTDYDQLLDRVQRTLEQHQGTPLEQV